VLAHDGSEFAARRLAPVGLEFGGHRDSGNRHHASLGRRALGTSSCRRLRLLAWIDHGVDIEALADSRQSYKRDADFGGDPRDDQFLAAGLPDSFDEVLIVPRVDLGRHRRGPSPENQGMPRPEAGRVRGRFSRFLLNHPPGRADRAGEGIFNEQEVRLDAAADFGIVRR
jgi:hypothetical protein